MKLIIAIMLSCLTCSGALYVSPTYGTDDQDGLNNGIVASLWFAVENLPADKTVLLSKDIYSEAHGTYVYADNVTIKGDPNDVYAEASEIVLDGPGIQILGTNVVVRDVKFHKVTGTNLGAFALSLRPSAWAVSISNCTFSCLTGVHGIYMHPAGEENANGTFGGDLVMPWESGHHNRFTHNVFTNNCSSQAIHVCGHDNLASMNKMYNSYKCDYFIWHGNNNVFSWNFATNFIANDVEEDMLHPDIFQTWGRNQFRDRRQPATNNWIINNKFYGGHTAICQMNVDCDPDEVPQWSVTDTWIIGNLFYGITAVGSGSQSSIDCPKTKFCNNTFVYCGTNTTGNSDPLQFVYCGGLPDGGGWDYRGDATDSWVVGNLFLGCGSTTSAGWYHTEGPGTHTLSGQYNVQMFTDNWSSWSAKDTSSHSFSGYNYSCSPCVYSYMDFRPTMYTPYKDSQYNSGLAYSPGKDLNGYDRTYDNPFTPGAYEY